MAEKSNSAQRKPSMPDAEAAAAIAYCRDLVSFRPSPLVQAAAALPPFRQALFYPAYAAMRIIDDFVDDGFFAQSKARRDRDRAAAQRHLAQWLKQAEAASQGRRIDISGAEDVAVFDALRLTLGQGTLGSGPWHALADAMSHDLAEHPLQTWADFDNYAEGAAVAPAAVFIYILGCQEQPGGSTSLPAGISPQTDSRALAKFCYLVHILRDLSEDARRPAQLVTIPDEVFTNCQLSKASLSTAPAASLAPLAAILWQRARSHRADVEHDMTRLLPRLGLVERRALSALVRVYDDQHAANRRRFMASRSS